MSVDLVSTDVLDVETLADGNALGCVFCAATNSTASCPGSSAASISTASTLSG
ncbi:MAG: thiocillin family RiPP [Ancrocorticia sp.]